MKISKTQKCIIKASIGITAIGIGAILSIKNTSKKCSSGMIGFGAANVLLGSIDLIEDKIIKHPIKNINIKNNNRLYKIHNNIKYNNRNNSKSTYKLAN